MEFFRTNDTGGEAMSATSIGCDCNDTPSTRQRDDAILMGLQGRSYNNDMRLKNLEDIRS